MCNSMHVGGKIKEKLQYFKIYLLSVWHISLYPSRCVKSLFFLFDQSSQQCKHCLIMCHTNSYAGQFAAQFQIHTPTPSHLSPGAHSLFNEL